MINCHRSIEVITLRLSNILTQLSIQANPKQFHFVFIHFEMVEPKSIINFETQVGVKLTLFELSPRSVNARPN